MKLIALIPGDYWILNNTGPWPDESKRVKILDVRAGWVRYDMGLLFRDERMMEYRFRRIYEFLKVGGSNFDDKLLPVEISTYELFKEVDDELSRLSKERT